jgi:hypothetical protein
VILQDEELLRFDVEAARLLRISYKTLVDKIKEHLRARAA